MPSVEDPFRAFQIASLILLVAVALLRPMTFDRAFARFEGRLGQLAEAKRLHLVVVFVLAVGLRVVLLPLLGIRPPFVADEYSILMQARLMAMGKWSLPTDPLWPHFEEMHVIVQPVLAAIYFPGRSLPLTLGLLVFGQPWVGILLTMAALATAVTWMLQAWVRPLTALLGGILVILHLGLFSYWVNGYWGGAITALGATLLLGAAGRLATGPRWTHGAWAAIGLFLLMTSRPYEGFMFCLGLGLALLPWLWRTLRARRFAQAARFIVPVLVAATMGAGVLMSHSAAISGDPLKPAYTVGRVQYGGAPPFLLLPPATEKIWSDAHLEKLYRWEATFHERARSPDAYPQVLTTKISSLARFFLGPLLLLPFLFGFFARAPLWWLPTLAGGFVVLGFVVTTWDFPHYAAPLLPCAMIFVARGFERLRAFAVAGRPAGLFLARTLPVAMALSLLVPIGHLVVGVPAKVQDYSGVSCCNVLRTTARGDLERALAESGGRHLVFVRYDEGSERLTWVYNDPDLASASIIWARDLGDARNRELVARFPGRRVWLVVARREQARILAYTPR